jgi:predicted nucleic acid-binding protein
MTLVLDASVAVKWFLEEEQWEAALALADSGEELIAPDLVLVETAHALLQRIRSGEVDLADGVASLTMLQRGIPELVNTRSHVPFALALAQRLGHSVYDCLYLALAEAEDCAVVTADRRLHERVAGSELAGRTVLLGAQPAGST